MLVATGGQVQAGVIEFSFDGDAADWPWIGRTFLPGTVTGKMFGLVDNAFVQAPTSIEFTSDVSALGMTSNVATPISVFGGIDIVGGVVQSSSTMLWNFFNPSVNGVQLRIDHENRNVLHWNGGGGPIAGFGNDDGFGGATFSTLDGSLDPIPEPGTLALIGAALVGYGVWRRRKGA